MNRLETRLRPRLALLRHRLTWLAVLALPIVVAACNKNGGSGY